MNVAQPPQAKLERVVFEHSKWLVYGQYDPVSLRLEVGFRSGSIVQHWPVYPQTWMDMKLAPSKGSFYHFAIKKVTPPITIKQ